MCAASPIERSFTRRVIRVKKEESAFFYFILESYEGMVSYSTLDFKQGQKEICLELRVPYGFLADIQGILERIGDFKDEFNFV